MTRGKKSTDTMLSAATTEPASTIYEIAKVTGVSAMTVSRVLNGRPDVAPATRERVLQAVAEHGYVRNRAAAALGRGRSGLIDLVDVSLDNSYHLQLIRGVEEYLEPTGYRLVVSATHGQSQRERQWLAKVLEGATDGAILTLTDARAAHFARLRQRGIPFVVVDHRGELGADIPSVGATNFAGGRMATEYLLSLGHRRIAMIGGVPTLGCSRERLAGYRDALDAAGLAFDHQLYRVGDFEYPSGYRETCALLESSVRPTAIFAANDVMAVAALKALHERGVAVPAQMSVVGFDDVEIAAWINPALTTVRQPLAHMGTFAATMLLQLIDGKELASTRVELATELIVRESCAAPRGRS